MPLRRKHSFDPNHLRTRDVLVLVPTVIVLLVLAALFAGHVSHDTYIRWGGLGLDSAVLLGFLLFYNRNQLRSRDFWLLFACFTAAHSVFWIVLLEHVGEWRLTWFTVMILEVPVFLQLRDRTTRARKTQNSS